VGSIAIEEASQAALAAAAAANTTTDDDSSGPAGQECAPPIESSSLPCANVAGEVTRRQLFATYIQPQLLCRQQQVAQQQCTLSSAGVWRGGGWGGGESTEG
jgi:hypothetical protein